MLKYLKNKPIISVLAITVLTVMTLGILFITKPSGNLPLTSQESAATESIPQTSTPQSSSGDQSASLADVVSSASAIESAAKNSSTTQSNATAKETTSAVTEATTKPKSTTAAAPSSNSAFTDFQTHVIDLVNKERTSRGLNVLSGNTKLSDVATIKSQDMAALGYFDHTSPTYGSPFDMMKQFGIHYQTAGENIAMGQTTPEQVMNDWMNSEGHRANILNAAFTQIGIGIAKDTNGRIYWTQMFIG